LKRVIALFASANSGKTNTLKLVHQSLKKMAERILPEYSEQGADLRDIFIINNIKVGLETQGDPGSRLKDSLKIFKREECKLIICATRSRGQTMDLVNKLRPIYEISWRGQSWLSKADLRDENNKAIAKLILKEAKMVIGV
jgi:hypothetical protein